MDKRDKQKDLDVSKKKNQSNGSEKLDRSCRKDSLNREAVPNQDLLNRRNFSEEFKKTQPLKRSAGRKMEKRMDNTEKPIRERLVLAGIDEINRHGIQNFSVRRIARECVVSCAAPYKHFKDKKEFYAAIIEYIQQLWRERQEKIILETGPDVRRQLVAVSLEYIRFLVENPHFRSILMLKEDSFDFECVKIKNHLTARSKELVQRYCREVNMSEDIALVKLYIIRSLIYGASIMFDNGELPYTPEIFKLVERVIDREFELP